MVGDVHFYSAEGEGGRSYLFDCGPPTAEARAILRAEVDLRRLEGVFLTHCHIDHYGSCPFLEEASGARIYMPRGDVERLRRREEHEAKAAELFLALGFDRAFLEAMRESFRRTTVMPRDFSRYAAAEEAPLPAELGLSFLPCPGHSQSDLVWLAGGEAVSGDSLLRGIFQVPLLDLDLGGFAGRFGNYRAWCDSIPKLASLEGRRVLPGHRERVEPLGALAEYARTLLSRARRVAPHRGLSLPSIVEELFRGRLKDSFHAYLKASEIVFMLDFLEEPGRLGAALGAVGLLGQVEEEFEAALAAV